jgi:hypothetical protein
MLMEILVPSPVGQASGHDDAQKLEPGRVCLWGCRWTLCDKACDMLRGRSRARMSVQHVDTQYEHL